MATTTPTLILTHPGGAHKDDLLACALLAHRHGVPIVRREPTPEELADPRVVVVDVGLEHAPERSNFDHHQFPRDHVPTCALSLVLQDFGLYEDARKFCGWLEMAEWLDCRGPNEATAHFGLPRESLSLLQSSIDLCVLRSFAASSRLEPGEIIYDLIRQVGGELVDYLESMRARLDFLAEHASFWTIEGKEGGSFDVLFVPRTEPLPDEPGMGLHGYLEEVGKSDSVSALVYPDRRGAGYGLSRYDDCQSLELTRVESEPDVHFAHVRGFVAKTSASDPERLKELLAMAWLAPENS